MYKLMENVLVVCKNDSTYYLDPESLVVFSKKNPKSSNEEIIRKYNKSKGAKQKNRTDNNSKTSTAIIELHVTNDCNLRCKYCFVDEKCHEEKYKQMSEDVIEKALFFALNSYLEASFFQICLFGGEPMLFWKKLNYLVKKAKEIFKDKKHGITFTTNGTIINDEILSFIKNNKISFQISCDGPQKQQDFLRTMVNNKGSFKLIDKNLPKFKSVSNNISVRSTITPYNMNLSELFEFFQKKGFKKIAFGLCSSSINDLIIKEKDLPNLLIECEKFSEIYLKHIIEEEKIIEVYPFKFYFQILHFGRKKTSFCGAGKSLFSVSTEGKLFSCHRFIENESYKIGDIKNGFDERCKPRKEFLNFNVENEKKCKKCFAKYACGGGCAHEKFTSFSKISCQFTRHIFYLTIWIYAELLTKHPSAFQKLIDKLEKKKNSKLVLTS